MKKVIAILMATIAIMTLAAACADPATQVDKGSESAPASQGAQVSEGTQASAPAELTKLGTSGQSIAQCSIPLLAGKYLGIFEKNGLDVSALYYNGGAPQLEANPSGDWQIGWIGVTAANTGILKYGMKVIGLSGFDTGDKVLARKDSDIYAAGLANIEGADTLYGTPELWKGKSIITNAGTVTYCNLLLTLDKLGLTIDDINFINMDHPSGFTAFKAGQGDLLVASSNWAVDLLNTGDYVTVNTMEGMSANMPGTIIASDQFLKEHEDVVVNYLACALEALLYAHDDSHLDQEADWYVQCMSDEFGTQMTKDTAKDNVALADFRDLAFYESLCATEQNGKTGMQNYYDKFYENHVLVDLVKEEDKETVLNNVDCSYLKKAIELYKQRNGIS